MKELEFILTHNSVSTTLVHTPVGWNAFSVNCTRDLTDFFGMIRTYNAKVQFVKDGADIVRAALSADGLKANVELIIKKRNIYTNLFETKFTGKLIFGEFKNVDDSIECGVIEGGIYSVIKNWMDTKLMIPSSAVTLLKYNGIASTFEKVNCLQREQGYPWYNESTIPPPGTSTLANPLPFTFKENDFADYQGGYLAFHNYTMDFSDAYNPVPVTATIYPIEILKNCKINIGVSPSQVTCYQSNTNGGWLTMGYKYRIYKVGSPDTILYQWGTTEIATNQNDPFVTFQVMNTEYNTGEFSVLAGEKYYVAMYRYFVSSDMGGYVYQPTDVQFWINWDAAISMNVSITAPLPEENFKCITAMDLFTQIGIGIGSYPVKSDFLTNYRSTSHGTVAVGNELVFLNGWAVGKIATREDYILTSLRQFIKALRVFERCGFGIENISGVDTLVIEPIEYFLNSSTVMNLPDVAEVSTEMATDLISSEISVGYQKYEYNDDFGLDEFNGTLNFKTPETNITKTLDLISPVRADGAGIDYIRKLRLDKIYKTKIAQNNKDVKFDNDLFCVYARWDTYVNPITYYKTIDNSMDLVPTPTGTAYPLNQVNYYLSPKRCLIRNGSFIKSFLWGYTTELLKFLNTENNQDVVSQFTAETAAVTEKDDKTVSSLNTALFHPVYITISIPGSYSIVDFLSLYGSGLFTFTYNGELFKGTIVDCNINMAYDQTSTIKLLSHISNDLTKLI